MIRFGCGPSMPPRPSVTYILEGEGAHADSAGHTGAIGPGDVQWMTAGNGVVHREMPSERILREGGRVHGFQLWVNLPRHAKRVSPRYQEIPRATIPEATSPDGRATVRVIAGEALGVGAVIGTHTPTVYHHWILEAGAHVDVALPSDHSVAAYVFDGVAHVAKEEVGSGRLAVLGDGDFVSLAADQRAQLLLLGGRPLNEPIAWAGPFVMNTEDEIREAIEDYQAGRMGRVG